MGTRWLLPLRALAAGLLCLAAAASPSPARAEEPAAEGKVTLRAPGIPLGMLVERLSTEADPLECHRDLRDLKAVVLVQDAPRQELLERVARVFGAEWHGESGRKELRRRRDVEAWLRRWRSARVRAEAEARRVCAELQLEIMERALAGLDAPPATDAAGRELPPPGVNRVPLARLLRSLGRPVLLRLARETAALASVREGGDRTPAASGVLLRYGSLTAQQQAWVREGFGSILARLPPGADLTEMPLSIFPSNDSGIEMAVIVPRREQPAQASILSSSPGEGQLEAVLRRALLRELGSLRTPPAALLGASITREGEVQPAVAGELPPAREAPPAGPLLRFEWLMDAALRHQVQVVADHHTRSARAPALEVKEALATAPTATAATTTFRSVLRAGEGWLLARAWPWPDLDEEETPYPLVERWLATRREQGALPFEDLLAMTRLTEAQLAGLGAYDDRGHHLRAELFNVRQHRAPLYLLGQLAPRHRRAAEREEGCAVRALPPAVQLALRALLPPVSPEQWLRLRLFVLLPKDRRAGSSATCAVGEPGAQPLWAMVLPVAAVPAGEP